MSGLRIHVGRAEPLGASLVGNGVNFAVFSERAASIALCLFDDSTDVSPSAEFELPGKTGDVWHGHVEGLRSRQIYGYRVEGPRVHEPDDCFDPDRILIDPYAKAITRDIRWHDAVAAGCDISERELPASDAATFYPKGIVWSDDFDWGDDRHPRTPWDRTVIYECHVKGMTARHPVIADELRGTFEGLASPPILAHLRRLGVTAVELMPVQQCVTERAVAARGLMNYWGYNTIGFFAPDSRFAQSKTGQQVTEFKAMVKAFHAAGIEVILDVVFNHTGEGDETGPTLSFRGIDNRAYYIIDESRPERYLNFTGCGNTLNASHALVRRLILDSLRYWVREMHVDGFRFDLASALCRDKNGRCEDMGLFNIILDDPDLAACKLIVEPWDAAPGGYKLGGFPAGYAEWNDRYRDGVRNFWRGGAAAAELGTRVCGSSDLFSARRGPLASINYITSHDGFTLTDVVSYTEKHNAENRQENQDGANCNFSSNWGHEGFTSDLSIGQRREQIRRALLATLALSRGVPMISMGDELGRTQRGNNNAYCQDNEVSWMNWTPSVEADELMNFVGKVMSIRREYAVFCRAEFYQGETDKGWDVRWLGEDGQLMQEADWADQRRRGFAMQLRGNAELLLLVNGWDQAVRFYKVPKGTESWKPFFNSAGEASGHAEWLEAAPFSVSLYERAPT